MTLVVPSPPGPAIPHHPPTRGAFPPPDAPRSNGATARSARPRRHVIVGRVAALLASVGATVIAGIFLVTPDGTGALQPVDDAVSRVLGGSRLSQLRATVTTISLLLPVTLAVLAGAVAWRRRRRVPSALVPGAVVLLAYVASTVSALLVSRPGPAGDAPSTVATSFPSVAGAMTLALALAVRGHPPAERRWAAAALPIAAAAAAVRIVTGVAWPLDEAAGAALGALSVWTFALVPGRARRRRAARRRRVAVAVSAVAVIGMIPVGRSYAGYLTAPGDVGVDQRTIEWLRDVGLGPLVDRAESWWLWRHLPSTTATITSLPPPGIDRGPVNGVRTPPAVAAPISPTLPGEGRWRVAAGGDGAVQLATTTFRPDPAHPSLLAGAAWIDHLTTRLDLIAGTMQPGGGAGPAGAEVPAAQLGSLLAAFNSGYKMRDTPGGALVEGRQVGSMAPGVATVGIRADGSATVGEWGRDLTAADRFVALRQNLHLMVDGGRTVPGLSTNTGGRWGKVRNGLPTWRSGLGVTAGGDLVYVAGDQLTLGVLGDALVRVGAVRAMELDIHDGMVTFNLFSHDPAVVGHKLLPDMPTPADRYLRPDWRDFFTVALR
jgi:membrane-associated phospholipid phosphatase